MGAADDDSLRAQVGEVRFHRRQFEQVYEHIGHREGSFMAGGKRGREPVSGRSPCASFWLPNSTSSWFFLPLNGVSFDGHFP
jgi:hypothetical protein